MKVAYNYNLDSHDLNDVTYNLFISPKRLKIEKRHGNIILKQMSTIDAGLVNQYEINYQTVLLANFSKDDEDAQESKTVGL